MNLCINCGHEESLHYKIGDYTILCAENNLECECRKRIKSK